MPETSKISSKTTLSRRSFLKYSIAAVVAVSAGIGGILFIQQAPRGSSGSGATSQSRGGEALAQASNEPESIRNPEEVTQVETTTAPTAVTSSLATLTPGSKEQLDFVLAAKDGDILGIRGERLTITENGQRFLVPRDMLLSGGPPPDGIPSIDNPKFVSAQEANEWLGDEDFVLGLEFNGVVRAYPHQILVFHEIVNDNMNSVPLAVTYCPLCFTGIAFERVIGDEPVEFGTSGKLYNSDLVMYDRRTRSYWSQITGQAIVGELSGLTLKVIPMDTLRWGEWKELHPDTEVLSRDTGRPRPYGRDPYGGYYVSGGPIFPVESNDDRLPAKAIVFGIFIDGMSKAYPEDEVARTGGLINDSFAGRDLLIVQDPASAASKTSGDSGAVSSRIIRIFERNLEGVVLEFELRANQLFDKQTGSEWSFQGEGISEPNMGKQLTRIPSTPEFWFARSSFFPNSELFFAE